MGGNGDVHLALSSHPTSATAARRFVREVLAGWECPEGDAAVACTDELVTNAIVHVCSDIEVVVRHRGGTIRIEAHDRSTRPALRPVLDVDAEWGRGLDLVAALSSRWGVSPTRTGKSVWFEVSPVPCSPLPPLEPTTPEP